MNQPLRVILSLFCAVLFLSSPARSAEVDRSNCSINGIKLFGKVQKVDSFPDLKVQWVDSFPDLKVQAVDSFPDGCGKWQFVDSFADYKVKFVDSFPDIKIEKVKSFPGLPD